MSDYRCLKCGKKLKELSSHFFKWLHKPKKSILTQVQEYFKEEYGVNVSVKVHIHTSYNNYAKKEAIEMGKQMAEKENMPVRRLDDVSFNIGTLLDKEIIIFFGGDYE